MAIQILKHHRRGSIRALDMLATADARGFVEPLRLPKLDATLLALATAPQQPSTDFDVKMVNDNNGLDAFDGCGLRRSGQRPMRHPLFYGGLPVHNCVCLDDAYSLYVEGLSPGTVVAIKLIYGYGGRG